MRVTVFCIALLAATTAAAQSQAPRLEIGTRQGNYYWVVETAADGTRRGGWVPVNVPIDSIDRNSLKPLPPAAVSSAVEKPLPAPPAPPSLDERLTRIEQSLAGAKQPGAQTSDESQRANARPVALRQPSQPRPVFAQSEPVPSHAWIDANFISVHSPQGLQAMALATPLYGEMASAAAAYPALPAARGFGYDGGVQFHPRVGVGVHFNAVNYRSTVGLAVTIPHPLVFNRSGSDADITAATLERKDRGIDISAMYSLPTPDDLRVRVFGGPTYFSIAQEMVGRINYEQVFNLLGTNVVNITTYNAQEVKGSAWGFNVGADVAYFFSRHVGVGGVIRFSRGTVTIDPEPLSGGSADLDAGATIVGGGVRFRF